MAFLERGFTMPEVSEKSAPRRAGRGEEEEVQFEQTLIPFDGNRTASRPERQASGKETGSNSATGTESAATIAIPAPFPDSLHEAVKMYRELGLTPIPLNRFDEGVEGERGKKPRIKGYRDATPGLITPEFIKKYWGNGAPANVGLVLRNPHVVIDLDSKEDAGASAELLRFMGYEETGRDGDMTRFAVTGGNGADVIDIETLPGAPAAEQGAGSVHHIAFAVENRARQLEVREALLDTGWQVTPVIDRDYFWAIYFRTPGGVLFEVATNEPGFDRDEDTAHLGEALKLPTQHAHLRDMLEQRLEPITD